MLEGCTGLWKAFRYTLPVNGAVSGKQNQYQATYIYFLNNL